ncbi:Phenylacetate-coenzyme A ligase [bacterium HR37]|nr:Phenylacetate-coenzyme A ligase [bacterium HR37]
MVKDTLQKLYGNLVVLSNLKGQRRIPYLSRERITELSNENLRKTIAYAAYRVPYYRRLFKELGIRPQDIKTKEDLKLLPIIERETVRRNPDLFTPDSPDKLKPIPFVTSGTSGKPLTVYHDIGSLLANIAFGERERQVLVKLCGRRYRELYISYSTSTMRKVWNLYRQLTYIPFRPERHVVSVLDPVEKIVEQINRICPEIIMSYGSYLETFFKLVYLRGLKVHLPKAVLYGGDSMTEDGRRFIEETLGIPVLSRYNAVEAFKIGFFCEERTGFHIHEDLCDVRIVGEDKKKNGKGEVVISNLVNRGMVLINYRLGDLGSLSNLVECKCGRTLSLLSSLDGRVEDIVFLPDGKFIHPRAIWDVFKGRKEVLQYQLIQHEPRRFELRLLTVDRKNYDLIVNDVINDLKALLGNNTYIECEYCEEIRREGSAKFKPVISLCKPEEFML